MSVSEASLVYTVRVWFLMAEVAFFADELGLAWERWCFFGGVGIGVGVWGLAFWGEGRCWGWSLGQRRLRGGRGGVLAYALRNGTRHRSLLLFFVGREGATCLIARAVLNGDETGYDLPRHIQSRMHLCTHEAHLVLWRLGWRLFLGAAAPFLLLVSVLGGRSLSPRVERLPRRVVRGAYVLGLC